MSTRPDAPFEERLYVPLRWWVQATMFVASVWLAFIVALPAVLAWAATAVMTASVVALFVGYGRARLLVEGGTFHAGDARIPVDLLADPVALDAEATRRLAGRDADARAHHVLRPYLHRGVKVSVTDPADPVPYWLVATRRPEQLAAALAADAGNGGPRGESPHNPVRGSRRALDRDDRPSAGDVAD